MRKIGKKRNVDFLLENKHYKRLHVILYIVSVLIIVLVYFLSLLVFSSYVNVYITAITSFVVGLYIVLNRNRLVLKISNFLEEKKRKKYKERSKEGLKSTLRKITPKNTRLKLKIKDKVSFKEKAHRLKDKFKSSVLNKKPKQDYIEIK